MLFLLLFVMIGAAAFACNRNTFLRRRPWLIGVIFGLLAFAANPLALNIDDWRVLIRDAPVIVGAFYFGPIVGLIAGAIAMVGTLLDPLMGMPVPALCPVATLLTALYAAALTRWFFGKERPAPVPAAIAAMFGEVMHLAIDAFSGEETLAIMIEIVYNAFLPEAAAYAAVAVVVAIACGAWRGWQRNFISSLTISMAIFAVAFSLFAVFQIRSASSQTEDSVNDARQRILQLDSWCKDLDPGSRRSVLLPMLADLRVGKNGYYLAVDRKTQTVAGKVRGHEKAIGMPLKETGIVDGPTRVGRFDVRVFNRYSRCEVLHILDWDVYCVVPFVDAHGPALVSLFFVGVLLFLTAVAFRLVMLRINAVREKLDALRALEAERQQKDLSLAKMIQQSALPGHLTDENEYKIFAMMDAAKEVGGDFYDFFVLPSEKICFLVADVSGKGVPGAMFMMRAKMVLRTCLFKKEDDLAQAIIDANNQLCENNDAEMFVTVWAGLYDRSTGHISYVNAGHNPPLVRRADRTVEWIRTHPGLPLAAMPGVKYAVHELSLSVGDSLLLYTDGVTEAVNPKLELYGEKRLEEKLAAAGSTYVTDIRIDISAFANGAEQADDITILALDRKA